MAIFGSADVGFLLAGGYSILGNVTQLNDEHEALVEETTALGDSYEESTYIGVKKWMLTQDGFYDDAAGASNAALATPGTSMVVAWAPEGNTLGAKCIASPTVEAKYTRQIQRGALTKAHAEYMSTGNHDEGKIVATLTSRSAASNTRAASLDNSALSSNGGGAVLEVTALSLGGYTNLAWLLEHSTDNSSFITLVTFATRTAIGAERVEVAAGTTVRRYLAGAWSYGGAGSGPTNTSMISFARA